MSNRKGLDRAAVVTTAVAMANREGIEALSLKRLAEQLGVQTPSLYNHVDGMPDLLRALALENSRGMADCLTNAAVGKAGPEALLALANAYRAYIKANPGIYPLGLRSAHFATPVDAERRADDDRTIAVAVAAVTSCGLSGDNALHGVRALRSVVHGFATLELAGGFGMPLDLDESFQRLVAMLASGIESGENQ